MLDMTVSSSFDILRVWKLYIVNVLLFILQLIHWFLGYFTILWIHVVCSFKWRCGIPLFSQKKWMQLYRTFTNISYRSKLFTAFELNNTFCRQLFEWNYLPNAKKHKILVNIFLQNALFYYYFSFFIDIFKVCSNV